MSSAPLPNSADLAELGRLYDAARYLDGYHLAQSFAPPEAWPAAAGLVLAGRFTTVWGDWDRGGRLHTAAWRLEPQNPTALYYHALTVQQRHGPFEALRFLHEQRALLDPAEPTLPHTWLWLHHARLLSTFRDFEGAEALLRKAEPLGAKDPWWWVERAAIRENQDRYDEALESVEEALRITPRYRPALESRAHLLMLTNRDEEALALLQEALHHTQVGSLGQMLAILLSELERHAEVLPVLDRVAEVLPCANRAQRQWIASRRSDALRFLGRDSEAIAAAREVKTPFFDRVAERLAAAPAPRPKPVQLRVGFVRQHHMTCAPATLAAIGNFWQRPVDHLELTRLICYDGTPDHEERHWAETHGWLAREFRVTWETATALLERGCPFTLTTIAPRSGHLQAVVGYDATLGLLLIRDPYQRTHGECVADKFLANAASHGPRGMVLVPADRPDLLAGLELPDATLYDAWYAVRRALVRHDRAAAQASVDQLVATAPDHRLTLMAQRELAWYDGNLLRQFETTRSLLNLFPDDPNFRLDEVQYLRALSRTAEMRERIAALVRKDPDVHSLRESAQLLAEDARTHRRAHLLLRRVLRRRAVDAGNLRAFANLLWSQQEFAAATEVYRLAACVGEKTESNWDAYFAASRHMRQVDTCLTLLREREQRLGAQSAQPTRTYFRACDSLDRTTEGFVVLEVALARRPEDGELLLFAAESRARFGELEESARLLTAAQDKTPRLAWLRGAARLAEIRPDHAAALVHYREIIELNPVDTDALRAVARLLAMVEGRPAALEFLRATATQHPALIPLQTLLVEWLRQELPEEALSAIDHLLSLDPENAWALREKALTLGRLSRHEEALPLADMACRIEPNSPTSLGVRGVVLVGLNRQPEARAAFETSVRLGLDAWYMGELFGLAADFAAKRPIVLFLQEELIRQAVPEDAAFLRFRELARSVLTPEETEAALEKILAAHRDHWAAWSAYGTHLVEQGKTEAALKHARESTGRFPLVARLWLDLAAAQTNLRQAEAEIESLRRALEISPTWGRASRALSDAHERALQLDAAEHVLRRALSADPLDVAIHNYLADLLWRRGQKAEALTLVKRVLALDSSVDWAWEQLDRWGAETGEPKLALTLAESLTQSRPGDAAMWLRLARLQFGDATAALATLDRALTLNPRDTEIHEVRAHVLAAAGRHEEALAACRPAVFGEHVPQFLLGRAAWIEHARGRAPAAVEQMRKLVAAHPDYLWGWSCLAEWHWEREETTPALEAATKWAWLAPNRAVPLGYVAIAQKKLGKKTEAKEALWRALEREPNYSFGAQTLLQWLAEDRDLEGAKRLLRHIETHLTPADAQRSAVLFEVMRRDQAAAAVALKALVQTMGERTHLLTECVEAMREAGWARLVESTLEPLLAEPGVAPAVARHWVNAWASEVKWEKLTQLEKRGAPETVIRTAWSAAIEETGRRHRTWRLRWIRQRRGPWLRQSADTWGAMGYALVTSKCYRETVSWLRDWPSQKELKPWMLYNLTLAYYHRRNARAAELVAAHALTLPSDGMRPDFLLWHGLECALRGDVAGARETLPQTENPAADAYPKVLRLLTEIVVEFHEAAKARSVKQALAEAKRRLTGLRNEYPIASSDRTLRFFHARVLNHLGAEAGSWLTRLQSRLPTGGRTNTTAQKTSSSFDSTSLVWIVIVVLAAASRGCGTH